MNTNLDLNPQFQKALDLLENSNSHLFITGKAGTGKSTLLNYFRNQTKKNHVVLAPTGIAAVNIEGQTIHSFFGFHPGITTIEAKKAAQNRRDTSIFRKLEIIIIDEVSMVRADLMDCMDIFLRTVRKNDAPFGGIKTVFIGDLYQLPPVVTNEEKEIFSQVYNSPYFFDSDVIKNIFNQLDTELEFIELQTIYRQTDIEFIDLLNSVRNKTITSKDIIYLNQRNQPDADITDDYIHLVTVNKQADDININKLNRLPGKLYTLSGEISGDFDKKSLPTDIELNLKVGARVMFVKNDMIGRWINGTLGTVTKIIEDEFDETVVEVKIDNGSKVKVEPVSWSNYTSKFNPSNQSIEREEIGKFTQIPLKLAWAITIHKSQGKTFDKVILDIGYGAFAHGQTYVALSRCRTFEGLVLKKPIKYSDVIMDERVKVFLNYMCKE